MWGQAQGGREGGDGDLMNVTDDENFDSRRSKSIRVERI